MRRELLIGCGSNRERKLHHGEPRPFENVTTLDFNADHAPDIVYDLERLPLPFDDDSFDEIHAYDVLEHTGRQGDWRFFFAQWSDFWRILKPNGCFYAIVPSPNSEWAWGDPSHSRVLPLASLVFLSQPNYAKVGQNPMSDFRHVYKADFDVLHASPATPDVNAFVLRAVKPARLER